MSAHGATSAQASTNARGLTRQLLAVGAAAGRRSEAGRVRYAALFAATALMALALASLVVVHATYEGQAARGAARTPVFQEDVPGSPARATWSVAGDSVPGSGPFQVVFLTRLTEDAPLPPGLGSWPRPGEAVLSPALRDHHAAHDVTTRYGTAVGTIAAEGLQSPDELFAYVVPRVPATGANVRPVTGYGPAAGPAFYSVGQLDYAKPELLFLAMIGLVLLLPAAVLLTVAARTGAHTRDRRTALVAVLGATPRARAVLVLGDALRPVIAGTLLALVAVATVCVVDIRLPRTGHVLVAADPRGWWWALLLTVLAAAVAVLAVVVLMDATGGRRTAHTRVGGARRSPVKWAVACPLLLLLAVRGPDLFTPGTAAYVLTNWIGVAGTLATLPAAVAVLVSAGGSRLAQLGRRHGRPGQVIAGRRAATHPGPLARMTAGVVVAIGLLLQVVAWQGQLGRSAVAAQATVDRIGSSALVVEPRAATAGQLTAFVRSLPTEVAMVSLAFEPGRDRLTVRGRCPALLALKLECASAPSRLTSSPADPRLRELVGWVTGGRGEVSVVQTDPVTSLAEPEGKRFKQAVLVDRGAADLSVPQIKREAYRSFPMGAEVGTVGGTWLTNSKVNQHQGDWLTLFGLVGIAVLSAASGFAGLAEFLRHGRALAPMAVLTGNPRVYWSTAAHSILVPLALAGLVGTVVGSWLALPQTRAGASYLSHALLAGCAAAALLIGVGGWVWGARVSVRQALTWRPRGE
ncbi:ABC transporter permease [Streptomyces sp. NPDC051561]|uniref:ABC transporter permease n=1 Tax=Streptomyces sp. NPDC051561 TaxID=3365658 RepID=UPI0037961AD7